MVRTSEEEEVMFCLTMEEWCGGAFKWCERSSDKQMMLGHVGMEFVSLFFLLITSQRLTTNYSATFCHNSDIASCE